jgi:epidermal growth factor receptor substrate 15
MARLLALGFAEDWARIALRRTKGNVDEAIAFCIDSGALDTESECVSVVVRESDEGKKKKKKKKLWPFRKKEPPAPLPHSLTQHSLQQQQQLQLQRVSLQSESLYHSQHSHASECASEEVEEEVPRVEKFPSSELPAYEDLAPLPHSLTALVSDDRTTQSPSLHEEPPHANTEYTSEEASEGVGKDEQRIITPPMSYNEALQSSSPSLTLVQESVSERVSERVSEDVSDSQEQECPLVEGSVDRTDAETDQYTSKEVSEEVSEEVNQEVSKEVSKEASKEESKDTSKDTSKEGSKEASKEASKDTSKEVSKEVSNEESKEVSEEVSEEVREEASKEASKEESKDTSKDTSKEGSKEASKEASKDTSKDTSKESSAKSTHTHTHSLPRNHAKRKDFLILSRSNSASSSASMKASTPGKEGAPLTSSLSHCSASDVTCKLSSGKLSPPPPYISPPLDEDEMESEDKQHVAVKKGQGGVDSDEVTLRLLEWEKETHKKEGSPPTAAASVLPVVKKEGSLSTASVSVVEQEKSSDQTSPGGETSVAKVSPDEDDNEYDTTLDISSPKMSNQEVNTLL